MAVLNWAIVTKKLKSNKLQYLWNIVEQNKDLDLGSYKYLSPLLLIAKANPEDNPT